MPRIIRDGAVTEDNRHGVDADAVEPAPGQVCTLEQWLQLNDKKGSAVQLEPDQPPAPLLDDLDQLELVVIHFPVFTDGRGFSYGRELRERGPAAELELTLAELDRVGDHGLDDLVLGWAESGVTEDVVEDFGGAVHGRAVYPSQVPAGWADVPIFPLQG